jgi:hypothetical protein
MMSRKPGIAARALALGLALAAASPAHAAAEQQSLEELRNTVINLLQALVAQGVITRERAEGLVAQAQQKAATDAQVRTQEEAGSVRVTYVPQVVRDQIRAEVTAELRDEVAAQVVATAKEQEWGVPGALPDWIRRVRWSGDVRLRGQADLFPDGNVQGVYLDFQTINQRGGFLRAGPAAFVNVDEDRYRTRVQARFGIEAQLLDSITAGVRLSTGSLTDPVSANQTLGQTGNRYTVGFDRVYLRWDATNADEFRWLTLAGGRTANPFQSTELLFDRDLAFEGLYGTVRYPFSGGRAEPSNAFLTLGAFPIQEVELSARDKLLLSAQLGTELRFDEGHRLRVAAALHDFRNVQGRRNAPDSTLLDYTAPQFLQRGNTLFDIRNDLDVTTNLFALAGEYRLANLNVMYEVPVWSDLRLWATGDVVENVGWKRSNVLANTGLDLDARTRGYQLELGVGHSDVLNRGLWRVGLAYRYAQRDAVLDAFTDSDFRGGGTDAKGYILTSELGVARNAWVRLRYYTGDVIDGVPVSEFLGVRESAQFSQDTVQLDVQASF